MVRSQRPMAIGIVLIPPPLIHDPYMSSFTLLHVEAILQRGLIIQNPNIWFGILGGHIFAEFEPLGETLRSALMGKR